ncbi:MAG: DUF1573 domain-containing protein, partial [Candidatus Caldatribacteriota bacterium]|nr:DUF1573 domain-containing protein [Candidatus Caldatribacteriota bacterium]
MKENLRNRNNIKGKIKNPLLIFSIVFFLFFLPAAQLLSLNIIAADKTAISPCPIINFQEETWDFGEITPDELPAHIFKFKNTGEEILIIKLIKVSCESCTDTQISTKSIAPGETAELEITVNSLDMTGRFTKRIYLYSNDPKNPLITLTVSG